MKKKTISICIGLLLSTNLYAQDFQVQVNSLHYATSINEVEYVSKLIEDDPKLASQLNKEGLTPIHLAIQKNSLKSLKAIFEEKINPNIKNSNKETPLVYAVKLKKVKAVEFLLSIGANKNIPDSDGFNSIYYAEKSNSKIKDLFFPKVKVREIVYQETDKEISSLEIEKFKKEINDRIKAQSKIRDTEIKALEIKIQENEDKSRIKTSVLLGSIKQMKNELKIVKLENEDLKNKIKVINIERESKNLQIWQNELNIKQLKEESKEFKRKQLMGIYSSGADIPETNPIVKINNNVSVIEGTEETIELINSNFEEINVEEVIIEESVILDFKGKN